MVRSLKDTRGVSQPNKHLPQDGQNGVGRVTVCTLMGKQGIFQTPFLGQWWCGKTTARQPHPREALEEPERRVVRTRATSGLGVEGGAWWHGPH